MADSLFRRAYFWRRLQANPLAELIQEYVAHFRTLGYSWVTVRERVQALEHFGYWLATKRLGPEAVNQDLVRRFLRDHLSRCRCPPPAPVSLTRVRPALNQLLRLLESRGGGNSNEVVRRRPIDAVIEEFRAYLCNVCGLSESTCSSRVRYAREFLEGRFAGRPPRWTSLRPCHVVSFVMDFAQRCRPSSVQVAASSLRCFLRYLQTRGWCGESLVAAVPRTAHWRLSSLPKALSEEHLREFLSTFDRSTANGCRDYAMALCQVILGLRVSEVAHLRLDDIEWRTGVVRIEDSKGRCQRELPLPRPVGQAIAEYIRQKRPPTLCRNVFLRHRGARGSSVTPALIRGVMRLTYAKVRGCEHLGGTHVLRHTAATRMLQRGARLKEIADVLGHRCLTSTAIYAKVDLPSLTAVSLPWPEVQP